MIHTENVSINEEFLLYKCKRVIHKNEKVYMTINSIDKDEEGYYILSFDLRYEGDKPIQVTKGAGNFSYLSKFKLIVKSNNIFKELVISFLFNTGKTLPRYILSFIFSSSSGMSSTESVAPVRSGDLPNK